jgi:hypothetical protein
MAGQIVFFEKNFVDISNDAASASASEASSLAYLVQNRSNLTRWVTTGSADSSNTTFTMDIGDLKTVSDILLLQHNFKAFTVEYWDGSSYQSFSPAISETTNTAESNHYEVTPVVTSRIKITITGTMVADDDKYLTQLIVTRQLGQLNGWPIIKNPVFNRNRKSTSMLSGKKAVSLAVGGFSMELSVSCWRDSDDLDLIESLYARSEGFLVWPGGGVESQFSSVRKGYRMEDLFLMRPMNDYEPEFYRGLYSSGLSINMKLAEVND